MGRPTQAALLFLNARQAIGAQRDTEDRPRGRRDAHTDTAALPSLPATEPPLCRIGSHGCSVTTSRLSPHNQKQTETNDSGRRDCPGSTLAVASCRRCAEGRHGTPCRGCGTLGTRRPLESRACANPVSGVALNGVSVFFGGRLRRWVGHRLRRWLGRRIGNGRRWLDDAADAG
jgi:hypothetical protein